MAEELKRDEQDAELDEEKLKALRDGMLDDDDVEVMSEFFSALSDPTRIRIVDALQQHRWLCVSDLAELLGLTKSAVSHQLTRMRLNKLLSIRRDGKRSFYSLNDDHVEKVFAMAVTHIREQ